MVRLKTISVFCLCFYPDQNLVASTGCSELSDELQQKKLHRLVPPLFDEKVGHGGPRAHFSCFTCTGSCLVDKVHLDCYLTSLVGEPEAYSINRSVVLWA